MSHKIIGIEDLEVVERVVREMRKTLSGFKADIHKNLENVYVWNLEIDNSVLTEKERKFRDLGYTNKSMVNSLEMTWNHIDELKRQLRCIGKMGGTCGCSGMSIFEETEHVVPYLQCVIVHGNERMKIEDDHPSRKCLTCSISCPNLHEDPEEFSEEDCKDYIPRTGKYLYRPCIYVIASDEQIDTALELHDKEYSEEVVEAK